MTIPGYDEWKLRGPEEHLSIIMEACPACDGDGNFERENTVRTCGRCNGTGEVEVTLDEPDGDYEYERRRDAKWEDGK